MIATKNVLIIEDHPMMIESYKTALSLYEDKHRNVNFIIQQAANCQEAYDKIQKAALGNGVDIVFLDIRIKPYHDFKILSGVDLGAIIRNQLPDAKIIVVTFHDENEWLSSILDTIQPDCFYIKSDINNFNDIVRMIENVLDSKTLYSHRVQTYLKHQNTNKGMLDAIDLDILRELANGAKMSELVELIPLGKSGIEKRIRNMKMKFGISEGSNRDLILLARKKTFV